MFYKEFLDNPTTEYYKHVYYFSHHWNGKEDISNKRIIIYCSHGFGDIIQFLRFIPFLKEKGCHIILHIPKSFHPLLKYIKGVDEWCDRDDPILPIHDMHLILLELPILLKIPIDPSPYINIQEKIDLGEGTKIGIAWECSTICPKSIERCCPLYHYNTLLEFGKLFKIQDKIHRKELFFDLELYGVNLDNWLDTAILLNSLDFIVSVDTAVLHLAGAMGKKTYALLCQNYDPRWDTNWYNSVKLYKGDWEKSFQSINVRLKY